jgi:glutaminyl-peptide cyclotransferase
LKLKIGFHGGWIAVAMLGCMAIVACAHESANGVAASEPATNGAAKAPVASVAPMIPPDEKAPPASKTGGFDGQKAYDYTAKQVSFGPRPPASDAIRQTQAYLVSELKGFGCTVDTDNFHAPTPIGDLAMENIVAKIPGTGKGIILLMTHYDTLRLPNFVGADDAGSSTGLMLEMANLLCRAKAKQSNSVWIAFVDGEEDQADFTSVDQAQHTWDDNDTLFGSRELAARMDLSGELKNTRAVILADMIGQKDLHVPPEASSTKWLVDLIWGTADRLGYGSVFVRQQVGAVTDDHDPFLQRGVPSVDIIEFAGGTYVYPYWHTPQDTMDKLSPKSFAVTGYVILESISALQKKFR